MTDDKYIEKSFLYLLIISLILHLAFAALLLSFQGEKRVYRSEPVFVDLQDLPDVAAPKGKESQSARYQGQQRRRVEREVAPKGERERDYTAPPVAKSPAIPVAPAPVQPRSPLTVPTRPLPAQQQRPGDFVVKEPSQPAGEGILAKPGRQGLPDLAKLFPSADKLAKIEENYRRKYAPEVAEGNTKFLNTDDILFGSFLRRFETAVYGTWRYPAEAVRLGLEGVTPVKITFNRKGEIVRVELLNSSGSRMLDEEVLRALKDIGPIGSFPKGYAQDSFNLIAFFQYGIVRGSSRGVIR